MFFSVAATGFLSGAGLIIAIGSQNAFVLRQGLERRHVGLVVGICALADIVLILGGVAGIGTLVHEWPGLLQVLRWGAAVFLAWYGWRAAQRAWAGTGSLLAGQGSERNRRRIVLMCLAFTFLNPHVYLDTMVLLGSLSMPYPGHLQWAFALGACVASLCWFLALGYGARLLQPVLRQSFAWRVLDACIAFFMWALCALLLLRPL